MHCRKSFSHAFYATPNFFGIFRRVFIYSVKAYIKLYYRRPKLSTSLTLADAVCLFCLLQFATNAPAKTFSITKNATSPYRCRECALPTAARRAAGLLMLLTTIHCFCPCQSSPRNIYLFFAAGRAQPNVDGAVRLCCQQQNFAFAPVDICCKIFNKTRRRLRKPNLTLTTLCAKNVPTLNNR